MATERLLRLDMSQLLEVASFQKNPSLLGRYDLFCWGLRQHFEKLFPIDKGEQVILQSVLVHRMEGLRQERPLFTFLRASLFIRSKRYGD